MTRKEAVGVGEGAQEVTEVSEKKQRGSTTIFFFFLSEKESHEVVLAGLELAMESR